MSPWTDEDRDAFRDIDEILRSVELEPAPPSLTKNVMQRIHAENPVPVARFRLAWIDYFLSFFAASMIVVFVLLTHALPQDMELYLRMEIIYWFKRIRISPLTPLLLIGGIGLLTAGVMSVLLYVNYLPPNRNHPTA